MARKLERDEEALKKALDVVGIHWDNIVIMCSKYDATHDVTAYSCASRGNTFAIKGQVAEWLDTVCDCGQCDRDDDDADEDFADDEPVADDADDDTVGNR